MKRKYFSFALLAISIMLLYSPLPAGGRIYGKQFREFMNYSMKFWNVPGAAVGIIRDGKIILAKGYGYRDLEKKLPVTYETLFAIGSTTKAFTAFSMALLAEEGKLDWDKPVKDYLPDFQLYDSHVTGQATPRDLAVHRTGLPRHDIMWYGSPRTREELYHALRYLTPSKAFRYEFQYQNLMYMTAGYLVGRVSGGAWEEVVQKRILDPLGMTATNFSVDISRQSDNHALPYEEKKGQLKRIPFYTAMQAIAPASGINSNVDNMLIWLLMNLRRGEYNDRRLISRESFQRLLTPQAVVRGISIERVAGFPEFSYPTYAMGWMVHHYRGFTVVHHGGNIDGFSSLAAFMPDTGFGVVVLTNKGKSFLPYAAAFHVFDRLMGVQPESWNERFKEILKQLVNNQAGEKDENPRKPGTSPSHPLTDYAGKFYHPGYGFSWITLENNTLHFKYNTCFSALGHYHYDIFEAAEGLVEGLKIQFLQDENGNIDRISVPLEKKVDNIVFRRVTGTKSDTHN
jgi:CubicO group peptidase (beta-lactamase class C family)